MTDFLIRMANTWEFSRCERPHEPVTSKYTETILVEARDNTLTIARLPDRRKAERRIYAIRTVGFERVTTFALLPELPRGVTDDEFFPALGTVVIFEPIASGRRRLRAVGVDWNSGRCRGWIFDAVEA